MYTYYIPHNLHLGDITHLSDSSSEFILNNTELQEEDIIKVSSPNGIFHARITHKETSSIEIEVLNKLQDITETKSSFPNLVIVQSIANDSKFNYFLEKSVEVGVNRIIPIESKYSLLDLPKAVKKTGLWKQIIEQGQEQSRNPFPPTLDKPISIQKLTKEHFPNSILFCLATEDVKCIDLHEAIEKIDGKKSIVIAIGPEKGWSISDLEIFKNLGFIFINLRGNILRTETAGLVISSIINFRFGKI